MAMTASITLNPSSATVGKPVSAILTISNSGAAAVNVINISPLVYPTSGSPATSTASAVSVGDLPLGPNTIISVPASGSLSFTFVCSFFAPSGSSTYSVGANCYTSDGASFVPTPATISITAN